MDKNEFIKIYNKFLNNIADNQDAITLLENYCIKMGKDPKESAIFAQHIIGQRLPLNYDKVLDYFAREFNVIEVYDKPNIYNNQINKLIKVL